MNRMLLAMAITACVCIPAFSQVTLEDAISRTVDGVKAFTGDDRPKAAVLIYSKIPALTEYVADEIGAQLVAAGYPLISHDIVSPGMWTGRREALEYASQLGAEFVIHGWVVNRRPHPRWDEMVIICTDTVPNSPRPEMRYDIAGATFDRLAFSPEELAARGATEAARDSAEAAEAAKAERDAQRRAERQAAVDDDAPARYTLSVTYTGAGSNIDDVRDVKIPMDYFTTSQHALSLSMGINVYKDLLNLGIDFGIKDFNFGGKDISLSDVMNIGGMIGVKFASLSIDYRFINGNVEFPSKKEDKEESVGNIAPGQLPYNEFSRIEHRTVALMFSAFNYLNFGLMWANTTGHSMVQNKYFDPDIESNAFGVRAHLRYDNISKLKSDPERYRVTEAGEYRWGVITDIKVDLGFGSAKLSSEVAEAIKADPDMGKPDLGIMYNGVQGMLGLHLTRHYSQSRYWEAAAGLDIQGGGATAGDIDIGSTVIGLFVRSGFAF